MKRVTDHLIEQRILANIIVHPDCWNEIAADFRPEYFSDPALKAIAEIIVDLTKGGKKPSSVRLAAEMRKRQVGLTTDDLIELSKTYVTVKETPELLTELQDLYKRRTVYQTLLAALDRLENEDKPTDELIADAQQVMLDAFSKAGGSDVKSMHDVAEKLFIRQERIQQGDVPAVYPFNLVGVQTLVGGLETGSITILAGRPSTGKTAYLLSECIGWAQKGLPGLIFSLEQEDYQIGQRNVAALEGIPVSYLREKLDSKNLDRFYSGLSKLRELPIRVCDRRGLNVDQICSIARLEKMREPQMKWIAVDYLTAMYFDPRQNRYLAIGEAVLKLRNLAKELDVFVVLVSQLNRGVESRSNKRPVMSDLRDSGNIEEYADVILFLYREGYYYPGFLGREEGDWVVEVEVAKNRQGGNAGRKTLAMFEQPTMRWCDCPSELAEKYTSLVRSKHRKEIA